MGSKGFVELNDIDVGELEAGPFQSKGHCLRRSYAHDLRWHAGIRVTADVSHRFQTKFVGLLLGHQDEGRRTIGDRAGVGRGDHAVFLEYCGVQGGFFDGETGIYVLVLGDFLPRDLLTCHALDHLHGHYFVLELAHASSHEGLPVTLDCKFIQFSTAQSVEKGQILRRITHDHVADGVGQAFPQNVDEFGAPELQSPAGSAHRVGGIAHGLGAPYKKGLSIASRDGLAGVAHGHHARDTIPLDRVAGDVGGNASHKSGHTSDVGGIGELAAASEDDIVEDIAVNPCALHHLYHDNPSQFLRWHVPEAPAVTAYGGPNPPNDYDFLHHLISWLWITRVGRVVSVRRFYTKSLETSTTLSFVDHHRGTLG